MKNARISIETAFAVAILAYWVGIGVESVGETSASKTYTWEIVPILFFGFAFPMLFAYLGGRKDGRNQ